MTQLTDKVYAIPMPEGAETCEIRGAHPGRPYPLLSFYGEGEAVELPPGEYQIVVFNTGTATEEDARKVVETIHIEEGPSPGNDFAGGWDTGYVDYENRGEFAGYQGDAGVFRKAIESLHSLLRSKGLDDKNNFAIIEKLK